ncbi:hypothetical protein, partial [Actinocorallia lasiicapitis]
PEPSTPPRQQYWLQDAPSTPPQPAPSGSAQTYGAPQQGNPYAPPQFGAVQSVLHEGAGPYTAAASPLLHPFQQPPAAGPRAAATGAGRYAEGVAIVGGVLMLLGVLLWFRHLFLGDGTAVSPMTMFEVLPEHPGDASDANDYFWLFVAIVPFGIFLTFALGVVLSRGTKMTGWAFGLVPWAVDGLASTLTMDVGGRSADPHLLILVGTLLASGPALLRFRSATAGSITMAVIPLVLGVAVFLMVPDLVYYAALIISSVLVLAAAAVFSPKPDALTAHGAWLICLAVPILGFIGAQAFGGSVDGEFFIVFVALFVVTAQLVHLAIRRR